ncbi:hypothetical protein DUHN55_39020 [Helicobacter pylori]
MGRRGHIHDHRVVRVIAVRFLLSLFLFSLFSLQMSAASATVATEPKPRIENQRVTSQVAEKRQIHRTAVRDAQIGAENGSRSDPSVKGKSIKFIAPPKKWITKTIFCSSGGLDSACSATIIDCRATGKSPRIVYMREEGSNQWYGPFSQCGDGYPPAPDTNDPTLPRTPPPPPVPTITQIREAFLELPFAKPTITTNPGEVDGKTLKDFKTYYAASWPDEGLAPGDVSKPVKLLSWTIEFKIASKDYRYDFGDGHTSGWTSSTGGVYPDGDVTHSYQEVGTKDIKVDARLVGQYRVNGGGWQDLGAVADLQDEPVADIEVVGTRTRLQAY